MDKILHTISSSSANSMSVLNPDISLQKYVPVDLSIANETIETIDIGNYSICQKYIDEVLKTGDAIVAYGGYLEKRPLYSNKPGFTKDGIQRNIHLGIDFWTKTGTSVLAPLDGKVHSFKNNSTLGDYGPTIILAHQVDKIDFYTLYGHLSLESLENLYIGKEFEKGEVIAFLGSPEINVGYAPHLHFQIICDMQGNMGNYPGVCAEQDLEFYSENCPNPNLLLKI
ncbi:MAG: peptidoglycan DD-metalloendopeptidase family protein [Aurantibacter sp.]